MAALGDSLVQIRARCAMERLVAGGSAGAARWPANVHARIESGEILVGGRVPVETLLRILRLVQAQAAGHRPRRVDVPSHLAERGLVAIDALQVAQPDRIRQTRDG